MKTIIINNKVQQLSFLRNLRTLAVYEVLQVRGDKVEMKLTDRGLTKLPVGMISQYDLHEVRCTGSYENV